MRFLCALFALSFLHACDTQDHSECYQPNTLESEDICQLLGDACPASRTSEPGLSPAVQVAPSEDLPEGVVSQKANNNVDIIWHENRLFFAFRTAPNHFASPNTVLYVVSTSDQINWTMEAQFALDTDLREPRFLSVDGRLMLYFAVLGRNSLAFEPQGAKRSEYQGACSWTEPEDAFETGFIPWRTKTIAGEAYLLGYVGGENIVGGGGGQEPGVEVHWLTTADGRNFEPVVEGQPAVLSGGSTETDFVFNDDGSVVAVSRIEALDPAGWGSKICRAEAESLGEWNCVIDPRKFDSPLMFRRGADVYLLARRNATETGNFDLGRDDLTPEEQSTEYFLEYWGQPKRCALWQVDPMLLEVSWVLDLPSNGDTCFPAMVPLSEDQFLVYNYTSPLDNSQLSWLDGQAGPTSIYRTTLTIPSAGETQLRSKN